MTPQSEASEIFRMFVVAIVWAWPYVRAVFIVWAVVSVTSSLSRISRNLERVVNRWELERGTKRAGTKPDAEIAGSLD